MKTTVLFLLKCVGELEPTLAASPGVGGGRMVWRRGREIVVGFGQEKNKFIGEKEGREK